MEREKEGEREEEREGEREGNTRLPGSIFDCNRGTTVGMTWSIQSRIQITQKTSP